MSEPSEGENASVQSAAAPRPDMTPLAATLRHVAALLDTQGTGDALVKELNGSFGLDQAAVAASLSGPRPGGEPARAAVARNWLRRAAATAPHADELTQSCTQGERLAAVHLNMETIAQLCPLVPGPSGKPFPQADRLSRLVRLIEHLNAHPHLNKAGDVKGALNDGATKEIEAERQVSYYTDAAAFLGLVQNHAPGRWRLTPFGKAWHDAEPLQRKELFARAMAKASPIFARAMALRRTGNLTFETARGLMDASEPRTAKINSTTRDRRARTVMAWIGAVAAAWPEDSLTLEGAATAAHTPATSNVIPLRRPPAQEDQR